MTKGAYAPPGQEGLYAAVVSVVGVLALLHLTLYRKEIAAMPRSHAVRLTTAILAVGVIGLTGFGYLSTAALYPAEGEVVLVPVFRSESLDRLIDSADDGLARLVDQNRLGLEFEIRESPGRLLATNAAFLFFYVVIELAIVTSLSVAGWRVAGDGEGPSGVDDEPPDEEA